MAAGDPMVRDSLLELIRQDIPIQPDKGDAIRIGDNKVYCTGKRIHVKSTGQIENFRLIKEYIFDPISRQYMLVGIVGREEIEGFDEKGLMSGQTSLTNP